MDCQVELPMDDQIQLATQEVMRLVGWDNSDNQDLQWVAASDKALSEDPNVVYARGYQAWQQGDYPRALLNFVGLVMLQPGNWHAYVALAGALRMVGEYKLAINIYTYALILNTQHPEPAYQIGICLYALGHIEESREVLHSVVTMSYADPNYSQIRENAQSMLSDIV